MFPWVVVHLYTHRQLPVTCCLSRAACHMWVARYASQPNTASDMGTPIQIAAVTQQKEILELLLSHGADPNGVPSADASSAPSSPFPPALILAASKNECAILKLLLEKGADPNAADAEGFTALHCTAESNCASCTQCLLSSGANWGMLANVREGDCKANCEPAWAHDTSHLKFNYRRKERMECLQGRVACTRSSGKAHSALKK